MPTPQIQWWLDRSRLPQLFWARIRCHPDGTADVLTYVDFVHGPTRYSSIEAANDDLRKFNCIPLSGLSEVDRQRIGVPMQSLLEMIPHEFVDAPRKFLFMPDQKIAELQYAMRLYVSERRWAKLETDHEPVAVFYSGAATATSIAAVDTHPYELAMNDALANATTRARHLGARAVYVEHQQDLIWRSTIRLYRHKIDDPYSFDWAANLMFEAPGPQLPPFSPWWIPRHEATPGRVGSVVYLDARLLAAFGRSSEGLSWDGLTLYYARRDDWDSIVAVQGGELS